MSFDAAAWVEKHVAYESSLTRVAEALAELVEQERADAIRELLTDLNEHVPGREFLATAHDIATAIFQDGREAERADVATWLRAAEFPKSAKNLRRGDWMQVLATAIERKRHVQKQETLGAG